MGSKCEEVRLSKSGPLWRDKRTSVGPAATSRIGRGRTSSVREHVAGRGSATLLDGVAPPQSAANDNQRQYISWKAKPKDRRDG